MRRNRENQLPLSGLWPDHRLAQELKAVSKILDDNPSILELVLHDLCDIDRSGQGARGLSAEQVLRAAILKNWHQLSYAKLAFHLSRKREKGTVRQANWHKKGGESPLKRRTNHPRFSASRAWAPVRASAKRR